MTPQELKNSILQLAIQGKLVEQRPEEGTAEELYRQILLERHKLDENKKIKKVKDFTTISEDMPFEIPENWGWSNIEILTYAVGNKENQIQTKEILPEGGLPVVSQGQSLIDGYTNQKEKIIDDLPLVMFGDHTRNVKFINFPFVIGADGTKFHKCILVYPLYIYYWMAYASGRLRNRGYARHYALLKEQYIPLPPLSEQKRIVAKIEELLPYIDRYEQAWSKLEDLNKRFPGDMQKSILQTAIQGKLVELCHEEVTGEELYQQIQAEKQRLIKAGTIKKEKPLKEITEDEKPFDIPENWKWIRLSSITTKLTDGSHNPPPNTGTGYPVISAKNVKNGVITFENVDRYTDERGFQKENPRTNISTNDIIMGIIGGSIGNVAVYTHDEKVIAQRSIAIIKTLIETQFAVILLRSPLIQNCLQKAASGSAQGGVYLGTLGNLIIPLPPLAEQKRIVAKLEEILPLCEKLKR